MADETESEDDFYGAPRYADPETVDGSQLRQVLGELAFFDDTFLNMQALNVSIVDQMIMAAEYALLHEWREFERTPTMSVLQVSALSQMWIFAVYELLRTWNGRIRDFRKQHQNGMLKQLAERLQAQADAERNVSALIRAAHARQIVDAPSILELAEAQSALFQPVLDRVSMLRMNLAKHETVGRRNSVPSAPGYGRINSDCGALDFEVMDEAGSSHVLNRRDLADALRNLAAPLADAARDRPK